MGQRDFGRHLKGFARKVANAAVAPRGVVQFFGLIFGQHCKLLCRLRIHL